jgi:hypothetical protein
MVASFPEEGPTRFPTVKFANPMRCLVGGALIERGLRNVVIANELLAAFERQLGIHLRRLCPGDSGTLLIDGCLICGLLDAKEEIVFLDLLALRERALLDIPGHPRHDIDFVDSGKATDILAGFLHLPGDHGRDGNRGWRRRGLRAGSCAKHWHAQRHKRSFTQERAMKGHAVSPCSNRSRSTGLPAVTEAAQLGTDCG